MKLKEENDLLRELCQLMMGGLDSFWITLPSGQRVVEMADSLGIPTARLKRQIAQQNENEPKL